VNVFQARASARSRKGRGRIPFTEDPNIEPECVVCYCGGTGWLPSLAAEPADLDTASRQSSLSSVLKTVVVGCDLAPFF
jgi:hypothetical protein